MIDTLAPFVQEEIDAGEGGTRWTDPVTGAWVELRWDAHHEHHPLADSEGVEIAFMWGSGYSGTAKDIPTDMEVGCPNCGGDELDRECPICEGCGTIELDDPEKYVRLARGALGVASASVRGGPDAIVYITTTDFTDPDKTAKAYTQVYESWAEGDCWGIVSGGPGVDGESVWGFIGRDYAEQEAKSYMGYAIKAAQKEKDEAAYWLAREVITIEGSCA